MSEDEQRYQAVAVIVGAEMICPDDHWNDEMRTRPDSAWTSQYHKEGDHVEFCGRPSEKDKQQWINAYIEAEDQVIELWRSGHKKARAILDLHYEIAYTCDDCGLWAHVEHVSPKDAWSQEERGGALFDVSDCDLSNRRRIHGRRITADEAWARDGDYLGACENERDHSNRNSRVRKRKRNLRKAAEYAFYYRLRKKEEQREATTEKR
jgi:hypothetical protein